ncbi:MAG: hypothetical protein WC824_09685, partial [Bacteroidota bacterium]
MIVIDAGSALRIPWQHTDGAGACRIAIGKLLGGLASTAELQDRIGILSATKDTVQSLQAMTQNKQTLASFVPMPGNSDSTSLLLAIGTALDTLERIDGMRRLIILSAGSTESSVGSDLHSIEDLARRAAASGTQVSAITFGLSITSDSLLAFLAACGTSPLAPASPDELPALIDGIEAQSIDTVRLSWTLRWTGISSDITAFPADLRMRESHPGVISCTEVTVRNTGEVPLEIYSINSVTSGFSSGTVLPYLIPVADSARLQLCYRPDSLGTWSLDAEIQSNSCLHPEIFVHLQGEATDSNTVSLAGDYVVKPGGYVLLPLLLDHALPAKYDLRRLSFSIGYDPSLLYPDMGSPLFYADGGT